MARNEKPKIAIVGAGAVGSLAGGFMALGGEDVTLIGKGAHVRAIHEHGLHIDGVKGEHTVPIAAAEALMFKPDIVFLAVKTQDVAQACEAIREKAGDAPIVLMQNGVRSAGIAAGILDSNAIVRCIVLVNAKYLVPGSVSCALVGPFVIGSASKDDGGLLTKVQSLLNHTARTEITPNIEGAQWTKLLVNATGNAMDAMTDMPKNEYIRHAGLRKICVCIIKEALAIVERAGIRLESLPGFSVSSFASMRKLPLPVVSYLMKKRLGSDKNEKLVSSTLQSLKRGRKTEIEYLNGEFVALGQRIGLPAPYNAKVVEIVREIEKTHRFYSPDALIAAFRQLSG